MLALTLLLAVQAQVAATTSSMQTLAADYVAARWRYSPTEASTAGEHGGDVDRHLDDRSMTALVARSIWLKSFAVSLAHFAPTLTDPEERADAELLTASVRLERIELDEAHPYTHDVDGPISTLGDALFFMSVRAYAPLDRRCSDLAARLAEVPRYLDQVQKLQQSYEPIEAAAALDDGQGLASYLDELPQSCKTTKGFAAVQKNAATAHAAVGRFLQFVRAELPQKTHVAFRAGPELFAKMFGPYLQTDRTPDDVLAAAHQRLVTLHAEMAVAARKVLTAAGQSTAGNDHVVTKRALDLVAADHPPAGEYFALVKKSLADAHGFVRAQKLLTLDARENLSVRETPEFLRSSLSVAAFDPAPALQPDLGAFYYFTPFPPSWTAEQLASKLREYNRWMIDILTIHEAMPGHYVQFERANDVQPTWRRTLRALLGSTAYIEGWACYAQDVVVNAGFRDGNPRLFLTDRKMELRAVLNSILAISLHARAMTDEAALKLMMDEGFQERAEAEGKLRRAKLSIVQLCSYFVGYEEWKAIRKATEPKLDAQKFHDRALGEGPVTFASLRALLLH